MRWLILGAGKPKLSFAREGMAEYASRIQRYAPIELAWTKASTPEREAETLIERSDGHFRIVLDERGKQFTSREFAAKIEQSAAQRIAVIVGSADGVSEEVRAKANILWCLGKSTLQHELALLIALEQIYRAHTILAGLPYHRDCE